jgi:hypothetical protein
MRVQVPAGKADGNLTGVRSAETGMADMVADATVARF